MKKTLFLIVALLGFAAGAVAQNWDYMIASDDYYCGEGYSDTSEKAKNLALSDLTGKIATSVSSDFIYLIDETKTNGEIDHQSQVLNCIKTYSQTSLTNVKMWEVSPPPKCKVRCYIERAEIDRMFDSRVEKAKGYLAMVDEYLERRKIDTVLKYYYWAYSLIRSVQHPSEVKDENGNPLVVSIENKIADILDNIEVIFENRDENDRVTFVFTYDGEPVSSLEFSYNDGQDINTSGKVKNGRGAVPVRSSHAGNVYHLNVQYEFKGDASGDVELEGVLNVVPRKVFSAAEIKVQGNAVAKSVAQQSKEKEAISAVNALQLKPQASQVANEVSSYQATMDVVIKAISARRYSDIANFKYFTADGLEVFNKLVFYGTGRVVGIPNIRYFKGLDSCVVARGLQMSFAFNKGRKQTFVEDVIFYFDNEGKIDNMSFGLGIDVTNEILNRSAKSWSNEAREIILQFLENYKTAYALERLDFIESIFSSDAQIIVGKVLKSKPSMYAELNKNISIEGQQVIEYNHYDKQSYLEHLRGVFDRNEFININFSDLSLRKITKISDKEKFVIQLAQDYKSSSYADKGYLMLLVDITNKDEPLIEIRTWQPNEVNIDNVFHEGMFYAN